MSSGQPTAAVTLTYRLPAPLPRNQVLFLADERADARAVLGVGGQAAEARHLGASVLVARMNSERTVGTVTTDHLSLKTWLIDVVDAVTATVGELLNQRHDPPECKGARPKWMNVLPEFLDDVNAPMQVCVQADSNDPSVAVVKIANNRGGALLVSSPVVPTWA